MWPKGAFLLKVRINGTHHYVLLYDIWVFTHRLNKENLNLRRGKNKSSLDPDKEKGSDAAMQRLTLKPFCSANWMMVSLLSLVVFVASKTATCPPSSVRYCRTSFNAAEAHCLLKEEIHQGKRISKIAVFN